MHRSRYHIIGIAHAYDIGIWEVGPYDGVLVLTAEIADRHALEVGLRVVHIVPVGIPVPASLSAGFLQSAKGWLSLARLDGFVDVDKTVRTREGHRDIAIVVEHSLVALAPLRGRAGRPRTIV